MTPDFNGSELELRQLEASLAQQEAQANQTRELLAQLKQSSATQPGQSQPAFSPSNTAFPFPATNSSAHDGRPNPPHGGSMSFGDLGQSATYQQGPFTVNMKRVKTCQPALHHPVAGSATKMARSKSSSYATPNPFTAGRGSVRPVPASQQGPVSTARFPIQGASPQHPPQPNNNIFASIPTNNYMGASDQLYGNALHPVMEHSPMMESPAAFLQRFDVGLNIPRSEVIVPDYNQHHLMHESSQSFASHDVPASQCGSLSSGLTLSDTSMTRSNSNANQSVPGLEMMGYNSQSFVDDLSSPEFGYTPDLQQFPSKKRSAASQSMLDLASSPPPGSFANYPTVPMGHSASIDSRLSSGHPSHMPHASVGMHNRHMSMQSQSMQQSGSHQSSSGAAQAAARDNSQPLERTVSASSSNQPHQNAVDQSEPMVRTDSARSAKSTQSQRERGKEALKRHNTHAAIQPLAPKPKNESSSPASAQSDLKAGADGSKLPMQKASGYVRPKRAKINCDQCDEHPDGFRGEHELRRHRDLKHSKEYKRFVCRTPAQLGLSSDLQPITPLEKCKHCEANKEYGQYYNAAAHLRRAHFKEKPPRASRSKNVGGKEESRPKRAGMGGGDWPPMAELKAKWMEEIKSTKPPQDAATVSDDEAAHQQDMEMLDGPLSMYMDTARFDDISFVGSNTDLQVQNNDVYTDAFHSDHHPNYTTSPLLAADLAYDPNMAAMPSNGSANFDFNSPINPPHPYFPHDLSIDLSLSNGQHFQSPNTSASTATLTPYNSFAQHHDTQFAQPQQPKSGQQQPMMGQPQQQDMLADMDFGLTMGAEFDDPSLHQS